MPLDLIVRPAMARAAMTVVAGALSIATALAGPGPAADDRQPIEVTREERAAYWQPINPRTRRFAGTMPMEEYRTRQSGYVDVEFIIDRDGRVQDIQILDSSPPGLWDDHARIDIAGFHYEPTPANSERHPVKVSQRFTYDLR